MLYGGLKLGMGGFGSWGRTAPGLGSWWVLGGLGPGGHVAEALGRFVFWCLALGWGHSVHWWNVDLMGGGGKGRLAEG